MKLFFVLCVFTATFWVRESDSFKILKKLKDLIHPTESSVSTTTVLPTIPAYENRPGNRDSDETSDSDESTDSKNSYNSIKDTNFNKYPGGSYHADSHTTETNHFNSGYGSNTGSTGDTGSLPYNNEITSTTTDIYGQGNNLDVRSTTPASYGSGSQNQPDQKTQSTTEYSKYNGPLNSYTSETPSSLGGVSIDDILSGVTNVEDSWSNTDNSQSTTTENSNGQVGGTGNDQSSVFSNINENNLQSTTSRTYYNSNDKYNTPEQSPLYSFDGKVSSTTPTYGSTNLNEIKPRPYPGSSYSSHSVATTSKTPMAVDSVPGSSAQGGGQQLYSSGVQPSYSTGKLNQTANQDIGDKIIFPDHPSLHPTSETERGFSENDPAYKQLKGYHNQKPASVPDDGDRRIIDAAPRKCGPGQTLDPKKNVCRTLARSDPGQEEN